MCISSLKISHCLNFVWNGLITMNNSTFHNLQGIITKAHTHKNIVNSGNILSHWGFHCNMPCVPPTWWHLKSLRRKQFKEVERKVVLSSAQHASCSSEWLRGLPAQLHCKRTMLNCVYIPVERIGSLFPQFLRQQWFPVS